MEHKKLRIAVLTAALTLGTGISAFAAGWVKNSTNGQWQYQDNAGYIVKNEWKKGADDQWRYLNSAGFMAVNSWVDDEYYVNAEGIMVAENWLQVSDPYSDNTIWYFFDSKGKAVKDGWKKINEKWYFFRSEEHTSELQSPS